MQSLIITYILTTKQDRVEMSLDEDSKLLLLGFSKNYEEVIKIPTSLECMDTRTTHDDFLLKKVPS